MFLKYLNISNTHGPIRHITFRKGLNLITNAPASGPTDTGNNVGKTTLLYLIDFCLAGDANSIYETNKNDTNHVVKHFLHSTQVKVELCLATSLVDPESEIHIVVRQFTPNGKVVNTVDGSLVGEKQLQEVLQQTLWQRTETVPSFRQIISHSIRISPFRQTSSLYTIQHATSEQSQAYLLYLFGADFRNSQRRDQLKRNIQDEKKFLKGLLRGTTLVSLQSSLKKLEDELSRLLHQKKELRLNPDFERDIDTLSQLKHSLTQEGVNLHNLQLRYNLLQESIREIESNNLQANPQAVAQIYHQAQSFCPQLHHTYEELMEFHIQMDRNRLQFLLAEAHKLQRPIKKSEKAMLNIRQEEDRLVDKLNHSASFQQYDQLIAHIDQYYKQMGELRFRIGQVQEVDNRINQYAAQLSQLDNDLYSDVYQANLQSQLDTFNRYFCQLSKHLYGEENRIQFRLTKSRKGDIQYEFSPEHTDNHSTGKKQGEITCFDLAYIPFAEEEGIPCLHFILNDQRELLDANQFARAAQWIEEQDNVQYLVAILRSKLPAGLDPDQYAVLTLSSTDRLLCL